MGFDPKLKVMKKEVADYSEYSYLNLNRGLVGSTVMRCNHLNHDLKRLSNRPIICQAEKPNLEIIYVTLSLTFLLSVPTPNAFCHSTLLLD